VKADPNRELGDTGTRSTASAIPEHLSEQQLPIWNIHFFVIAAFCFLILFVNLRIGDLSGYDDAFHAEQGRAMLQSGDFLTVRHNGYHNPEFPPLFYWMEAASMRIFGATDFAAKFPSALLGFGTVLLVYFIAQELMGQVWLALISMVVLAGTQYFIKYSGHSMTDVPFCFFGTMAVFFYLKGYHRPPVFLLSGAAMGLALLTRPFVGVVFFIVFLLHMLWIKRYGLLFSRYVLGGAGVALSLPLIWYAIQFHLYGVQAVAGPFFLIFQQLSSGKLPEAHSVLRGLLNYPVLLIKLYWPWLPFLLVGLWMQARKAFHEKGFSSTFLLAWAFGILIPFSFGSARQLRYIMPDFPSFAILAAIPIHQWIQASQRQRCFRWLYVLGTAAIVFMLFFPGNLLRATDMRALAPVADSHSRSNQRVILYTAGSNQWNYLNQFLWYSHRNSNLATTFKGVMEGMKVDPAVPVIMDRESFASFKSQFGDAICLNILGESKNFFCFNEKINSFP
jgi:4-amino-4-deoxy-L-arabinose transferase-like glycosyltransferase